MLQSLFYFFCLFLNFFKHKTISIIHTALGTIVCWRSCSRESIPRAPRLDLSSHGKKLWLYNLLIGHSDHFNRQTYLVVFRILTKLNNYFVSPEKNYNMKTTHAILTWFFVHIHKTNQSSAVIADMSELTEPWTHLVSQAVTFSPRTSRAYGKWCLLKVAKKHKY